MELLSPKKHLACRPLLSPEPQPLGAEAVVRRIREGRVWANDEERPTAAVVVWNEDTLCIQVLQRDARALSTEALRHFLLTDLLPTLSAEGNVEFRLTLPSFHATLGSSLVGGVPLARITCRMSLLAGESTLLPPDFVVRELDKQALDDSSLGNATELRASLLPYWLQPDEFVARGWGLGLLAQRRWLAWGFTTVVAESRSEVALFVSEDELRQWLPLLSQLLSGQALGRQKDVPRLVTWSPECDDAPSELAWFRGAFFPLDAFLLLARHAALRKRHDEATDWYLRVLRLRDTDPEAPSQQLRRFTNMTMLCQQAAREAARARRVEDAIEFLERVLAGGVRNQEKFAELLSQDEDFIPCQPHQAWSAFLARLRS